MAAIEVVRKDLLTTKGDLFVRDGTDLVRVGVGSDDQVLTADSAQASGLKWAAASGGGAVSGELLAKTVYDPGTDQVYTTTSTSFADVDGTNLVLPDFDVPASGDFVITLTAYGQIEFDTSSTLMRYNIRDGSGNIADSDVRAMQANQSGTYVNLRLSVRIPFTGLSGTKSGWSWGFARAAGAGDASVAAGPAYGPALMEVHSA